MILPFTVLVSFALFLLWWGKYLPPKINVEIVLAYFPLLVISSVTIFFGRKKKGWQIAIVCIMMVEALFFAVRPFYVDYQVKRREPMLASYLEQTYPGQQWRIDYTERNRSPYSFPVIFENEKEITYFYHVDGSGKVSRTGYAGWKEGEFKHYK